MLSISSIKRHEIRPNLPLGGCNKGSGREYGKRPRNRTMIEMIWKLMDLCSSFIIDHDGEEYGIAFDIEMEKNMRFLFSFILQMLL